MKEEGATEMIQASTEDTSFFLSSFLSFFLFSQCGTTTDSSFQRWLCNTSFADNIYIALRNCPSVLQVKRLING